jgi:DeoR/GlpR family transcriptional regulator of sugar metabolism
LNEALPGERQREILRRLNETGRVLAAELATEFAVSEDSIRRDLRELAALGLCRRVYGGALSIGPDLSPLSVRHKHQTESKQLLAQKAASLVRAGQSLLIDAGSTNSALADALPEGLGLTVITTAPDIAQRLVERDGFAILLIGGRIDRRVGAAVGAQTVLDISRIRADLCFPGTCAIDPKTGVWGIDSEESLIKRAMLENSGETAIVVTADKFGAAATHHIASVSQIDHLVVEHDVDAAICAAFEAQSVTVHRADAPAGSQSQAFARDSAQPRNKTRA